jgi:predicted ArsR family transcriptional regulator
MTLLQTLRKMQREGVSIKEMATKMGITERVARELLENLRKAA